MLSFFYQCQSGWTITCRVDFRTDLAFDRPGLYCGGWGTHFRWYSAKLMEDGGILILFNELNCYVQDNNGTYLYYS